MDRPTREMRTIVRTRGRGAASVIGLLGLACACGGAPARPSAQSASAAKVTAQSAAQVATTAAPAGAAQTQAQAALAVVQTATPQTPATLDAGAHANALDAGHGAGGAASTTTLPSAEQVLALNGTHSTSLGSPSRGTLEGAVALPDQGPGFVHNHERPDNARYGTVELV